MESKRLKNFQNILVLVCGTILVGYSFRMLIAGFGNPLIDSYGFRQAQTALTSYWFIEEGYRLNYITPVLGPPWSIPFEFPVYQYIVAFLQGKVGLTLDQTGRFVNILFYYVSAGTLFFIFRLLKFSLVQSFVPLAFFLGSPLYLFWSRTFMIESTSLAFGLLAILFYLKSIQNPSISFVCMSTVCGLISALTKITTFGVCLSFLFILFLWHYTQKYVGVKKITHRRLLLTIMSIIFVPIAIAMAWNGYADFLKSKNPLATFIISENLSQWNFGTIEMKLALDTWLTVLTRGELIIGSAGFIVLGFVSFLNKRTTWIGMAAIISFFTGPVVFTNLYVVHEYYFYANGIFLLIFISSGVVALLENRYIFTSFSIVLTIIVAMQFKYNKIYPPIINYSLENPLVKVGYALKNGTQKSDIVLIYGGDWNSAIPYYAERKSLMDRNNYPLENDVMQQSLDMLGEQNVGAVLFCEARQKTMYDDVFRQSRVDYFDLSLNSVRVEHCDIYFSSMYSK